MLSNLLQKVLVSTTVGTVIGFSTILGAMNSAAALTVESESFNDNNTRQDISHIAFFIKDDSGNVNKVKIDSVSDITSYDATNFLKTYYPDSEVVAYQVKSSTNKSFVPLSEGYSEDDLPTEDNSADITYNYNKDVSLMTPIEEGGDKKGKDNKENKNVTNEESTANQTEESTASNEESQPSTVPNFIVAAPPAQTNSSTQPVSVPEPGSIAAIAIFGLGGLLRKKKASS